MKDPARTWNALVVGEDTPSWSWQVTSGFTNN
jgi:hypothetical protein